MADSPGDEMVWEGAPRRRPRRDEGRPPLLSGPVIALSLVVIVLLALPLVREARGPGERVDTVPEALVGRWTTSDTLYAGRFLEIGPDRVALGMGEGLSESYAIDEVRTWSVPEHQAYELTYQSPEGEQVMEVFLHADGVLRLKNPSQIQWRKE